MSASGANNESDTRLTQIVNMKPKGIISCRSNNDVAQRTFHRSPRHVSPLSHGLNEPVLSSGIDRDTSNSRRDNSVPGRNSYLRSVGNAVVQEDVRKSVDRLRMSNEKHLKSRSNLEVTNAYDPDSARRGTAPTLIPDDKRQPKSTLNRIQKDSSRDTPTRQELTPLSVADYVRANTSFGGAAEHQIGTMMLGQPGFIKRITAPHAVQSKSALAHNKENQSQPREAF